MFLFLHRTFVAKSVAAVGLARHTCSNASRDGTEVHEVVIALGSNLGDRGQHMRHALRSLQDHGVKVLRHSALYETVPAYVPDQPNFLNAAVLAKTTLEPLHLLRVLKGIEAEAGRELQKGVRFGPRPLDLDIIFYGDLDLKLDNEKLQIPHPRWQERSFVKAPVADLYRPSEDEHGHASYPDQPGTDARREATTDQTNGIRDCGLVKRLRHVHRVWNCRKGDAQGTPAAPTLPGAGPALPSDQGEIMQRVMPLTAGRVLPWGARTYLMAVLNATPDSFSDGGVLMAGGLEGALHHARQLVRDGADILDVGGQSTRPGATRVSEEEEAGRVIPLIRAMREDGALKHTLISVDTFCASIARRAVAAGADIVNDVSGGSLDRSMMTEVAALGVPYVLMHMRGKPQTMQQAHDVGYGCTWRDVGAELQAQADTAMASGIAAWNIVMDPGFGAPKTDEGILELIRHLGDMRQQALQGSFCTGPLLVGPSRKSFLGRLTGRTDASQRDAATLASVVACVATGGLADIVRVHNVKDTIDGLKVADALYRQR